MGVPHNNLECFLIARTDHHVNIIAIADAPAIQTAPLCNVNQWSNMKLGVDHSSSFRPKSLSTNVVRLHSEDEVVYLREIGATIEGAHFLLHICVTRFRQVYDYKPPSRALLPYARLSF